MTLKNSSVNSDNMARIAQGRRPRDVAATSITAAVLCSAFAIFWFGFVAIVPDGGMPIDYGRLISSMYDPPQNAIENALVKGDGQIYAGQATDPLVAHPEMVRGGPSAQAFRYQRPMYGWLGWITSAGQRNAVAWALVALTVGSIALLVYVVSDWLVSAGAYPGWALLILLMPGILSNLTWIGPEALGMLFIISGLKRWLGVGKKGRISVLVPDANYPDWNAVAFFSAAGLCHETLMLVPFVLVVNAFAKGRLNLAAASSLAAAPYLIWVSFLRIRIGAWPRSPVQDRLTLVPFKGLFQALGNWYAEDWFFAAGIFALALLALAATRGSFMRQLIGIYMIVAAILGEAVWHRFQDFGRVLLPLTVLSLVGLVAVPAMRKQSSVLRVEEQPNSL